MILIGFLLITIEVEHFLRRGVVFYKLPAVVHWLFFDGFIGLFQIDSKSSFRIRVFTFFIRVHILPSSYTCVVLLCSQIYPVQHYAVCVILAHYLTSLSYNFLICRIEIM